MKTKFKKIKQVSAVDQVSDSLRDMIASGELEVGARLPSEAALAESYGVNRITVRMALQKLSVLGLVETRVGEGSFITCATLDSILGEIPPTMFSYASMDEVLQLRRLLELESIKLALTKATEEELEKLGELALRADASESQPEEEKREQLRMENAENDFLFHQQLVLCGHNQLFSQLFQLFTSPIKAYLLSIFSMREEAEQENGTSAFHSTSMHHDLYLAIREKNWKKCKHIYTHMTEYVYYIEA